MAEIVRFRISRQVELDPGALTRLRQQLALFREFGAAVDELLELGCHPTDAFKLTLQIFPMLENSGLEGWRLVASDLICAKSEILMQTMEYRRQHGFHIFTRSSK